MQELLLTLIVPFFSFIFALVLAFGILNFGFNKKVNIWTLAGILLVGQLITGFFGNFLFPFSGTVIYIILVGIALYKKFGLRIWQVIVLILLCLSVNVIANVFTIKQLDKYVLSGQPISNTNTNTNNGINQLSAVSGISVNSSVKSKQPIRYESPDKLFSVTFPMAVMGVTVLGDGTTTAETFDGSITTGMEYEASGMGFTDYIIDVVKYVVNKTGSDQPGFGAYPSLRKRLDSIHVSDEKASSQEIIFLGRKALRYTISLSFGLSSPKLRDGIMFYDKDKLYDIYVIRKTNENAVTDDYFNSFILN